MLRRNLMGMGDLAVPGLMATAPCPSKSHRLLTGSSVDTAIGSVAVLFRAAIAVASFWASTLVRKRRPLRFRLLFDALKISGAHERVLVPIVVSLSAAPHKTAECQGLAFASFGATTRSPLPSTSTTRRTLTGRCCSLASSNIL